MTRTLAKAINIGDVILIVAEAGRSRKVRCIQSFGDAQTCRRCEERGSECVAQTYSTSQPLEPPQRWSSRHRIAELESKVLSLTETVRDTQAKLEHQATQTQGSSVGRSFGIDSSDGDPSVSEHSIAEQPSHLRLLFQNDWLSVDSLQKSQQIQGHRATSTAHLLDIARKSLQRLIPSKDELSDVTRSASDWLTTLNALFPLPSMAKSQEEVVASYEEMHSSNVDTIRLASWLLTVAITAEQLPQEHESMASRLEGRERRKGLSKAISDTVGDEIISHDSLTGSIQGLAISMQFIRL